MRPKNRLEGVTIAVGEVNYYYCNTEDALDKRSASVSTVKQEKAFLFQGEVHKARENQMWGRGMKDGLMRQQIKDWFTVKPTTLDRGSSGELGCWLRMKRVKIQGPGERGKN